MAINKIIKVLVVEDSQFFREILVNAINRDPGMEVIAQASDAQQAKAAVYKHHPDVMTLDIELPGISGIQFLKQLLPRYSIPVIMVSSLNKAVFDTLEAGAVDFVNKPIARRPEDIDQFVQKELLTKIKIASIAKLKNSKPVSSANIISGRVGNIGEKIIAIGASTGGTEAIFSIVKRFELDIPGVIVTQHMPPGFTKMYADRLNNQCKVRVKEAENGDIVTRGSVLIAPGDKQMRLVKGNGVFKVDCRPGEKVSGHCPSVDVLFDSVAAVAGNKAIGVILTGMGGDGAKGLMKMKSAGAQTIGQDESSCVVYGMPKVAYDMGAVTYQLNLEQIPGKIYGLLNK